MSRTKVFLSILRGSLLMRRGRVALAVLAIAIGTSVAAALLLVSRDVGAKVEKELRAYGPNAMLVSASGGLTVGAREFAVGNAGTDGVLGPASIRWLERERVAGRVSAFATMRYAAGSNGGHSFIVGITEPAALASLYPAWRINGNAGEAVVGSRLARTLGAVPGRPLDFELAQGAGHRTVHLSKVQVVATGGGEDDAIFVSPRLTGDTGDAFQLALVRVGGSAKQVLAWAAQAPPEPGASLRPIKRLSEADGDVLKRLSRLLATVTAVALLAALLCAMSTLADLVLERTREVALLRSLGAGKRDVLALFASEAVVIGLVGGTIGLGIGVVAAQAIGKGVFGTSIAIAPVALPATLGLGVVTALLASLLPVRHALGIEPAPVLRGE